MKRTGIVKKIQAALMLLACPFAAFASQDGGEDYHPFVVEGKTWTMRYKLVIPYPTTIYHYSTIKLEGDTIIDGINFKKRWKKEWGDNIETSDSWNFMNRFIGENGGKIYLRTGNITHLILDYTLKKGDRVVVNDGSEGIAVPYTVENVSDTILLSDDLHKRRKCLYLRCDRHPTETDVWIEGIGSLKYGIEGDLTEWGGSVPLLMKCTDDESVLYRSDDDTSSIHNVESSSHTGTCFDLQGRRLNGVPQRGMYIRDGRKYVVK